MNSEALSGVPSSIEADIHIKRNSEGAALVVLDDNTREGITLNLAELEAWGKENAKAILKREKKTRQYGFFIVTAVRRAKRYQLKCWESGDSDVAAKLSFNIFGASTGGELREQEQNVLNGWISPPKHVPCFSFRLGD